MGGSRWVGWDCRRVCGWINIVKFLTQYITQYIKQRNSIPSTLGVRKRHSSWLDTQLGSISFTTSVAFSIFKMMSLSYLEKRPLLLKLREERRRRSRDTPDKQNALSWLAELHVRYSASPVQFPNSSSSKFRWDLAI